MNKDKREMIRMVGWTTYLRILAAQHQLKFFLFFFLVLVVGVRMTW